MSTCTCTRTPSALHAKRHPGRTCVDATCTFRLENEGVNGLFKTIWVSAMSLVCTSAAHEATHWPGRIAQMGKSQGILHGSRPSFPAAKADDDVDLLKGFAFFIYVVVALYVSSLASFLVLKPAAGAAISNLPEIARLGGKLCLLEAMSGPLSVASMCASDA